MPELPEVETTRRGIAPHVVGRTVTRVIVRQPQLRWPVTAALAQQTTGERIESVDRRGKYILLGTHSGTLILHLGMSGSLRIVPADSTAMKHDHVDIVLNDQHSLRFRDPRRFGALLWTRGNPRHHPLLASLGPEPLDSDFSGAWLHRQSRHRSAPIKSFVMDSRVVAGVGNIYANEALFLAGIHPKRAAGRLSEQRCRKLADSIRWVLSEAIEHGGTTLRDFVNETGSPGYFQQMLHVYGRTGKSCHQCQRGIRLIRLGQRSTFYCPGCQH
jgi:formamidopyrimidine-DNA glycosylase